MKITLPISLFLFSVLGINAQVIDAFALDGVRAPTRNSPNSGQTSLTYLENPGTTEAITVGNSGAAATLRAWNPIIGFELPTLSDSIQNVTLNFTRTTTSQTFSWEVMLYAFQPNWNPRTQSEIDVFHMGTYSGTVTTDNDPLYDPGFAMAVIDDRSWVRHLPNPANPSTGSIMTQTSHGDDTRISINLTSFFTGSGALADFYNPDGTPTTDYIWFRMSPNDYTGNSTARIRIFEEIGESDSPTLAFTVIPEPGLFGLTAGMLIFFGVFSMRRRLRS